MFGKLRERVSGIIGAPDTQIFRFIIPVYLLASLVYLIAGVLEGKAIQATVVSAVAVAVSLVAIVIRRFVPKHAYTVFFSYTLLMNCIVIPVAFIVGGGFESGIPFCCLGLLMLCAWCKNSRQKAVAVGLSAIADLGAVILSFAIPDLVIKMPENMVWADIVTAFIIDGVGLLVILSLAVKEFTASAAARDLLSTHIDSHVVSFMTQEYGAERVSGKKGKIAVMFVDISGFTGISESMTPETTAGFLNFFFGIVDECIKNNDGILDKYIGDCAMAYWIDHNGGEAVEKACKTAEEIRRALKKNCEEIYTRYKCDLECAIGINYGEAIIGEVGSKYRKDYTVIGDTVNVASRLENIAPGGTIYLSAEAAAVVSKRANIAKVPKKVVLKGKNTPVDIYTLLDMDSPERLQEITPTAQHTGFVMHVCGSRGSYSLAGKRYYEYGGETSCYIFKKDKYALIVDCGSGLQRAREIIADCTKIDIILTHVHYDHIIGLLDWSIFPAFAELSFYGNFDKWRGENTIHELLKPPYWPVDLSRGKMNSVETQKPYTLGSGEISAIFYPASHPNEANLVVLDILDKRVCIMADCENPQDLPLDVVRGCDMLMYDGMYEDRFYHEHIGWGHSTWESGVRLAIEANVNRLVITHHSPRNSDEKLHGLELEAQELFPATTFAKAGDRFII